jgi:hypothetical protein
MAAVEEMDRDGESLAPGVVEKDVLDVGLGRTRFGNLGHQRTSSLG